MLNRRCIGILAKIREITDTEDEGDNDESAVGREVIHCELQATPLGLMGSVAQDVSGIAFSPSDELFGWDEEGCGLPDELIRIDPSTGEATLVGLMGINSTPRIGGLDFDPDTGTLYLSDGTSLYTVDTSTGVATNVGLHRNSHLAGIVFCPRRATRRRRLQL